jgi:hypothetical protein
MTAATYTQGDAFNFERVNYMKFHQSSFSLFPNFDFMQEAFTVKFQVSEQAS